MCWDAPCSTHGRGKQDHFSWSPYLIDLPIGTVANKLHQFKDSCRILGEKEGEREKKFNKQYSQISAKINIRQRQINISLTNILSLLSFSGSPGIHITVTMSRSTAPSRWQPCRALPARAAAAPLAARLCPVLPTSSIWAGRYQAGACEQAAIRLTIICLKYERSVYVLNRIVIIGY